MDIKSTDNKKFSFIIAIILILAAVAGYFSMYPIFEKRAAEYAIDTLSSSEFLYRLYEGSCVLYKDITEAVTGKTVGYADLYLEIEDELLAKADAEDIEGIDTEYWDETTGSVGSFNQMARERMNNIFTIMRSETLLGLATEMDYCAIDDVTGKSIKNTGREVEKLATEEADENLDSTYAYYVKVSYDKAGNLKNVAVKGKNSDELLKNVQVVMKSNHIWSNFWSGLDYGAVYSDGTIYFHDADDNIIREKVTVSSTPKNSTYIFALTYEQQEKLLKGTTGSQMVASRNWEEWYSYYQAGTDDIFRIFLCVLAVLALLPICSKKYCLHKLDGAKLHIEVSIAAGIIMLGCAGEWVIGLVNNTNEGHFEAGYLKYIPWLSRWVYPALTDTINILILFILFGLWYYLVTSLGEVFTLGIMEFLRQRSLIRKCWLGITGFCKGNVNKLKEEILHVDLGEKADKTIRKLVIINFVVLVVFCFMWMFGWVALILYSIVLYIALKKYIQKIQEQYCRVFDATRSIADGNLQTEFKEDWGVFESYKEELSRIQNGFKAAVEEEVKSQKMKTELITNVSHDLKTPLTAITTYIELLEDENITPEQRKEYLEVLKKKSARLKFLIEDLFEVSKATSGNITLNPVDVDICNLMRQVYLEYEDKIEDAELIFRFKLPEEKIILSLDSQKTYRIFENLYINIIKYAMPHTRVYINAEKTEKGIFIELKNMSASELNIAPDDLTERFVRGDSARNTEGSGLGLAIARSFVELQGGKLRVEIDGDLFKVTIEWQPNR